jgi:zinc and cadmium transporter
MQDLAYILAGTLVGGICSVLAAAFVSLVLLERWVPRLVSFAVGVLLAVALTDLLPEAVESGLSLHEAATWLLGGIVGFFAIEKLAIWRHDHGGRTDGVSPAATMIVLGDGMHNFVDGVLIAAAFLQDTTTGLAVSAAVIAHEIPQEVGDFMVLLQSGLTRRRALLLNLLSSLAAVVGGVLGWFVLSAAQAAVPYALVLAAAGFIYVAVADLVPVLHQRRDPSAGPMQIALIMLGVGIATLGHVH